MKVAVYAISKNEASFAERWVASMSEADEIYVLDTGSTDGTPALLRGLGVHVTEQTVCPWRFDAARNLSLALVPEDVDVCVCTDLDEVFHKGWREALERGWLPWAQMGVFRYTWSFTEDGGEGLVFQRERVHSRQQFRWVHPVHEVLQYTGQGAPVVIFLPQIQLDHHPDPTKSRGQYLPLLELAVAEAPEDDRSRHYLGREYFYYRRWDDCIRTLRVHLNLPTATWADERAASMDYIAKSYAALGQLQQARQWHLRACGEAPWMREMWLGWAEFSYAQGSWEDVLYACRQALGITHRPLSYLSHSRCWGSLPYDLAAIAAWRLGLYPLAVEYGRQALAMEPEDPRLRENMNHYTQSLRSMTEPHSK